MEKNRSRSFLNIFQQHSNDINTISTIHSRFIIFSICFISLFATANAQRYVGTISPGPGVAVGKCNDTTCSYFTFGSSKSSVTSYYPGTPSGYVYAKDDYEFPRTVLQGLRYAGYFNDVQNNTECGNSFYETYSIGEVSVGTDNISSPCYLAIEAVLIDKGFKTDISFNPKTTSSNGAIIAPNLALFVLLSLLFPIF
jgi:hypothetical protein